MTHQLLIETACKLIARSGADGVSITALAQATDINRSTIYYHFGTRDDLIRAVHDWSREQISNADAKVSRWVSIGDIPGSIPSHADLLAAWIDDYIIVAEIRDRYPQWDNLVAQVGDAFASVAFDEPCDAEAYCALMLVGAFCRPRNFASSMHPFESLEGILDRLHARAAALNEEQDLAPRSTADEQTSG